MSNDISNMATLDAHGSLADSELDAVSGGSVGEFIGGIAARILDRPSLDLDKLAIAVANAIGRVSGGGW